MKTSFGLRNRHGIFQRVLPLLSAVVDARFNCAFYPSTRKSVTNLKITSICAAVLCGFATAQAAPAKKAPKPAPIQKVTVSLPGAYRNNATTVRAGKPVALTFFLESDAGCGNIVSVPAAKWTRTLKVGQKATLIYTPKKSGPLLFQCDMAMYKGTLRVK